jgi:hypothetical protein
MTALCAAGARHAAVVDQRPELNGLGGNVGVALNNAGSTE